MNKKLKNLCVYREHPHSGKCKTFWELVIDLVIVFIFYIVIVFGTSALFTFIDRVSEKHHDTRYQLEDDPYTGYPGE